MKKNDDSFLLKKIIEEHNLTQQGLANILGETRQYINQIINNEINMSKKLYDKIKERFPLNLSEINLNSLEIPDEVDFSYLEFFRKYHKYTKTQMAELLNICKSYYSKLENNQKDISEDVINKIKILNYNPHENIDTTLSDIVTNIIKIKYQPELFLDENYKSEPCNRFMYFDKRLFKKADYRKCTIVSIKGNYLEPLFYDSDKILIEECNGTIIKNEIYAICYKGKFYIRKFVALHLYPTGEQACGFEPINYKYGDILPYYTKNNCKDFSILYRIISKADL